MLEKVMINGIPLLKGLSLTDFTAQYGTEMRCEASPMVLYAHVAAIVMRTNSSTAKTRSARAGRVHIKPACALGC